MSRDIKNSTIHLNEEEKNIRNTDMGKIVFTEYNGKTIGVFIQNNTLIKASVCSSSTLICGDIYIAKVRNVAGNIGAYFVNIDKNTTCFLSYKEANEPILLNRAYDGRLIQGDEILVKIIKPASKNKQASVSCKIGLTDEQINNAKHRVCYTKVYSKTDIYTSFISSCNNFSIDEIITDDKNTYEQLIANSQLNVYKIRFYNDNLSLNSLYSLRSKMEEALSKRIWLKSGGFLVIEQTEALTVIDVNSGKFESKKPSDEYILTLNLEATKEIAHQLMLRNISGIIIVDFINMSTNDNKTILLEKLKIRVY